MIGYKNVNALGYTVISPAGEKVVASTSLSYPNIKHKVEMNNVLFEIYETHYIKYTDKNVTFYTLSPMSKITIQHNLNSAVFTLTTLPSGLVVYPKQIYEESKDRTTLVFSSPIQCKCFVRST